MEVCKFIKKFEQNIIYSSSGVMRNIKNSSKSDGIKSEQTYIQRILYNNNITSLCFVYQLFIIVEHLFSLDIYCIDI